MREGKSKVLLEASASGCAVVTNNVIGCNDVFIHNKNSILAKKGDFKSLVLGIEKIIKDTKLLKKIQKMLG